MTHIGRPVRRQVEELRRSYDQLRRIPADEYMEYAVLTNQAGDVWRRAKEASDFQLFRPVLEKLVAFNIKFAGYYDSAKAPYDALLNEYERGVDPARKWRCQASHRTGSNRKRTSTIFPKDAEESTLRAIRTSSGVRT